MVNYTEDYRNLVQKGVEVFDGIIALYLPDRLTENDWADITTVETGTYRNGLLERLAAPRKLTAEDASTFIVSTGHYLDSHWADYKELPTANPDKRRRVEELHAELEAVVKGVGQIYNALRTP